MSADGKTIDFVIAEGIKAHDGSDIDLEDAWWRMEFGFGESAAKRPGVDPTSLGLASVTDSIEKVDERTLRLVFQNPRPDTPFLMSENSQGEDGQIFNADYWKEITGYNAAGGDISQTDDQAYQNAPSSCGSMKFVSQVPGQKFVLERFDDYFYQPANGYPEDRRPKFRQYVTEVVPESATRIAALQAGQADMIEANVFMLEDIEDAGGQVVYQPEAAYSWIVYVDCWDPELWCYDKRVRQALEYAIDKEANHRQPVQPRNGGAKGLAACHAKHHRVQRRRGRPSPLRPRDGEAASGRGGASQRRGHTAVRDMDVGSRRPPASAAAG